MKHATSQSDTLQLKQVYAFAYIECWLEAYAKSHSLSFHELTERVFDLLRANRTEPIKTLMSKVRRPGTKKRSKLEQVAMDDRSRTKLQRVKKKQISGIKAYWAAMTPEQRSREMKRRMFRKQAHAA